MLKLLDRPLPPPPSPSGRATLEFRFERLVDVARDIAALATSHYAGLPPGLKKLPLEVDWERCLAADMYGFVHVMTVRSPEANNKLVGYVVNQVMSPFMHANSKFAFIEAIYLADEYREGWTGYKMLKKNQESMKKIGCQVVKVFCPIGTFEQLLKRLKYDALEIGYFKVL